MASGDDVAVLMVELEPPIAFKCANATGIAKGDFCKLTESMTAVINSGAKDAIAGIAAAEKIASDGNVTIPIYMRGIFKCMAAGAILIGAPLSISATTNRLQTATGSNGATVVGYALEAPSGNGQTFLAMISIGAGGELA
jgi:predicted RecA/RadA family phage recombinase